MSKRLNFDTEVTQEAKAKLKDTRQSIKRVPTIPRSAKDDKTPVTVEGIFGKDTVEPVSLEAIKKAYPRKISDKEASKIRDRLNTAIEGMEEHGMGQYFKEVSVGYLTCLEGNQTNSLKEYINAAKFLSFRNAGDTLIKAYARTFPDRVKRMEEDNLPMSYLSSYAKVYSQTALVTKLQTASSVPHYILFQDIFYKAIKTQADIMGDDRVSPKVRSDAANSLMTHLKTPETKQMELNIGIKESNILEQFKEAMSEMAEKQKHYIDAGDMNVIDVSHQIIYDPNADENHE